jgi:ABC-type multidrug transport system permease subunit
MTNTIKKRGLLFLGGLVLGIVLGVLLNYIWFFFGLIVLGYGDSGPEWLTTVNRFIYVFSLAICLLGSQVFYHYVYKKKPKLEPE